MAWAPTTEQLLNMDPVRQRADRFRFELIRDGAVIGELHPDLSRPPKLKTSTGSAIMRSMSGLWLTPAEVNDVDPRRDRVRPVMVLQNGAEQELALLMWSVDDRPRQPWGVERAASMVDETWRIDQGASVSFGWNKGANVSVILFYLLSQVIPSDRVEVTYDATTLLGAPKGYPPGTSRLRAGNEMAALLGYLPVHQNRAGIVRSVDPPDVASATPVATYTPATSTSPYGRIVAGTIDEGDNLLTGPNRFVTYEASGQTTGIRGVYDVPDDAPNSIQNRDGVVVTDVESQQGLTSVTQATKASKTRSQTAEKGTYRVVSFASTADWRHDVFDVVGFQGDPDVAEVPNWLEIGHELTLRSGGLHTHDLRRVY